MEDIVGDDEEITYEKTTYALKIINKSALSRGQVDVIRGEASILREMYGKKNVV